MNNSTTEAPPTENSSQAAPETQDSATELQEIPTFQGARSGLPIVILPGGQESITSSAANLFQLMAPAHKHFSRGGRILSLSMNDEGFGVFEIVGPDQARSAFEKVANLVAWRKGAHGKFVLQPVVCSGEVAKGLLASAEAKDLLPRITGISNCPLIYENGQGQLQVANQGYDETSKWYVFKGGTSPEVELTEAVKALTNLLSDYDFQSEADKSRAIASFLSPALKFGGFIKSRIPADVAEADQSQSGKTYRQKLVAAIYNDSVSVVAKREGGVGSVDESFSEALVKGRPFIQFDNFRGKVASTFLESFMTAEGSFPCRIPHKGSIDVRPEDFIIFMSSNGVETTRDFANRSSIIRIRKRASGFKYEKFPEGDLLNHVKFNQPYFLGAVFSVIRAWQAAGKKRTEETRHDFREWSGVLDWIVQNCFKLPPIMDGHREAQERVSNPDLVFLRAVAVAYGRTESLGEAQTATEIAQVCESEGINIPGVRQFQELELMARPIGGCLGRLFKDSSSLEIEGYVVTREITRVKRGDGEGNRDQKSYRFERIGTPLVSPIAAKSRPEDVEKNVFSTLLYRDHQNANESSVAAPAAKPTNRTNRTKGS